jgi:multidrug transporter EmrE-like cation transporter
MVELRQHRMPFLPFERVSAAVTVLLAVNLLFNVLASAAFRISARSASWREVMSWQVTGNAAGFVTAVTLTGLLRYVPLSIAFPVTTGMSILGVQVIASWCLFHEPIDAVQWLGSLLIGVGIFLLQR